MKAVINATPLIALALIDKLALLPQIFDDILVAGAVYDEIVIKGAGRPGSDVVATAEWLYVQAPESTSSIEPMLLGLDPGELETLLLAREVQADWVLIDERLGRRTARAMGLEIKGTVGILLVAFHAGLLSGEDALAAVQELVTKGIRIGSEVISWFEAELE